MPSPPVAEPVPLPAPRKVDPRAYVPRPILYLEPDHFPEAPPELRRALDERGCRIPQIYDPEYPPEIETELYQGNLVSGHFKSTAELHWAVLCSVDKQTSLLVFDSSGRLEDTLGGPSEDYDGGFIWYVDEADREHILEDHANFGYGTLKPPPIFHEGVEEGIVGKGSWIHYWHDCQWIGLQGGD